MVQKTLDKVRNDKPETFKPVFDWVLKNTPMVPFVAPVIKSVLGGAIYDINEWEEKRPNKPYEAVKSFFD